MSRKDSDKTPQKPVPDPPRPSSDLVKPVSAEEGKLVKGGPSSNPWTPKAQT